ncbi:flagellar hook-basal body complex protein FliE [Nocardioides marinus]|uniref:Flagellar hook-basal body complex protein FliE n=1 Tax=Nocardioides marinus TaxID=374514 RepID=A0A7Z0C232_9ACTN|nr:flagellar hook-basal body complex protein FliE [Nocardioides marinus]NYI08857.1 flagellar hook-basal body complex protein FliE [Nocardioides marinus]
MSIGGIEGLAGVGGFTPFAPPTVPAAPAVGGAPSVGGAGKAAGPDFGELVLDGLDRLDGVQRTADQLSVQAATGDLQNIHDYTIAATQAAVTTQVTVAIRNKAVEAFTEIMRMQV